MILTPIALQDLAPVLTSFRAALAGQPMAQRALDRIAATVPAAAAPGDPEPMRRQAVDLARAFGIETLEEEPAAAFSWDGVRLRTLSEPSVVVHEVAHWQLASPERRGILDFGLGAGPESGRAAEADAALCVSEDERQLEEILTSLLGILWEAELGQPAILAFLEQNWLEGYKRPGTPAHFARMVRLLFEGGFIDAEGRPLHAARQAGRPLDPA